MEHQSEFNNLLGKRIWKAYRNHDKDYIDKNIIILEFTDGTSAELKGGFKEYSREALDEYEQFVDIKVKEYTYDKNS